MIEEAADNAPVRIAHHHGQLRLVRLADHASIEVEQPIDDDATVVLARILFQLDAGIVHRSWSVPPKRCSKRTSCALPLGPGRTPRTNRSILLFGWVW
jgi:hypothetical protein